MTTLTLRRVKGSPLTHQELDDNFVELDEAISSADYADGITINSGDINLLDGNFNYNPSLAFHDLEAGEDRVIYDSSGAVLVGTGYNGLASHLRVSRVGEQLVEIGSKTGRSGQATYLQLGNAGDSDGRSCGIKATQTTTNFEDWKLSLVAHSSTDGFVDAIVIEPNGDVAFNTRVYMDKGLTINGDIVVTNGGGIVDGNGNSLINEGSNYTAGDGLELNGSVFKMSGSYSGTFTATGDIVAFSDMSLKENVNPILNALDKVSELNGITFNRIGEKKFSTGLSAQDVREVLPEAVHTDENGIHGVAYGNLVGLLVEAIKELKSQVDGLKG